MPKNYSETAREQKSNQAKKFFIKGISIALLSGVLYGVYSACLLAATGSGHWGGWYGGGWYEEGVGTTINGLMLSFAMACLILGALGSGINDFLSALWMMAKAAVNGKFPDFLRSIKTKPGAVMIVCAVIGGPIASTAYLIALTMSGPIATPISALCPAIGAILSRFLFKQKLNFRMICGILICVLATFMIGSSAFSGIEVDVQFLIGLSIAFIAALGWGIEGAVAGYGTSVLDYEIGITIRQTTSGFVSLFILVPSLFLIAGNIGLYPMMLFEALQGSLLDPSTKLLASPLFFFLISGLAAGLSFGFWYKGNSMCGTALGMACNGTFSFWVPFFSFLVCGLYLGWGYVDGSLDVATGYVLTPIQWAAAFVMVGGILLIAVNPLKLFSGSSSLYESGAPLIDQAEPEPATPLDRSPKGKPLPFNYALLKLFPDGAEVDSLNALEALEHRYSEHRQFKEVAVNEALMTAEANGLIEEVGYKLDSKQRLRVFYRATDNGKDTIETYIGAS